MLSLSHCQLSREGLEPLVRLQRLKLTLPLVTGKNNGVANIELISDRAEKNDDGDRSIDPGFDIIARIESLEEFVFEGNGSHSIGDHLTAFAKTKLRRLELSHARLSASDLQRMAQEPLARGTISRHQPGIDGNSATTAQASPRHEATEGARHGQCDPYR